jgi:hypothetical protein
MTEGEEAKLVGSWRTDPNDTWSLSEYGDVSLRFEKKGKLVYTVHMGEKEQVIHLTYRADGPWLVTNQPSCPQEERSEFYFTPEGSLAVKNARPAPPTFYVRE